MDLIENAAICNSIRAELASDDSCTAAGITTKTPTPVLALCRELLASGLSPDIALHVYRRGILALRVRSIGEGAGLTVKSAGNGTPVFALSKGAAGSPVRFSGVACGHPASVMEVTP